MKFILTFIVCLTCFLGVAAQPEKIEFAEKEKEANKTILTLGREDADGTIVENIEVFTPKDIPIYCYVDLPSDKLVTVKLNFIAVKVKGVRPNSKVISIRYKTKKNENSVTFTGKPEKYWTVGKYRVDILIDDKLTASKSFVVEKPKDRITTR